MYSGKHWSVRKAEADRVHRIVRGHIDPDWPMFTSQVEIEMKVYFKNRRVQLDWSNIPVKMYEDALIGWLIEDDKPQYVRGGRIVSLIDREAPRVEIEVSEIE